MTALRKTTHAVNSAGPFAIRSERASDAAAREALLDASFGTNRHLRTCQRLRDGALDSACGMIVPTGAALVRHAAKSRRLAAQAP